MILLLLDSKSHRISWKEIISYTAYIKESYNNICKIARSLISNVKTIPSVDKELEL